MLKKKDKEIYLLYFVRSASVL